MLHSIADVFVAICHFMRFYDGFYFLLRKQEKEAPSASFKISFS
jgi:hypothetical protein